MRSRLWRGLAVLVLCMPALVLAQKVRDVFGPEEYNRRITPDSQKISALESKLRELEQTNSLLEKLPAQGKLPVK